MLRAAGHRAPVTVACGVWSLLSAAVGAMSTCLTGPTNALLTVSGERHRHYTAGIVCGLLAMLFGLFVPLFTRLMLAAPAAFVAALGGLAMLRVLQTAFTTSFGGRCTFGSFVTFVVAVSNVTVLNIGGAFWGLLAGLAVSCCWSATTCVTPAGKPPGRTERRRLADDARSPTNQPVN